MDAGSDDNVTLFDFFERMVLSDGQKVYVVAGYGPTQGGALTDSPQIGVSLDFVDVGLQVGVGVGVGVGKIHLIAIIRERVLPSQGVVRFVFQSAPAVPVFVVVNILSTPMPAQVFLLRLFLTIYYHLHPHPV